MIINLMKGSTKRTFQNHTFVKFQKEKKKQAMRSAEDTYLFTFLLNYYNS